MQARFAVIFDILSGDDGLLMMCLLRINAQRMLGCINDLHNAAQQFSLILVLFPRVHCNQSSRVKGTCEYLVTGHLLFGSTHHYMASLFLFRLSGIVLLTGISSEDWVKGAVCSWGPRLCRYWASTPLHPGNYSFSHSHSLTHSLVETEEIDASRVRDDGGIKAQALEVVHVIFESKTS